MTNENKLNPRLKLFIESNVELIDNNQWKEFFKKADELFFNNYIMRLVDILDEVDIITINERYELLAEHLKENLTEKHICEVFGPNHIIDVRTLVDEGVDSYFGFDKLIVGEYIIDHIEEYKPALSYNAITHLFETGE